MIANNDLKCCISTQETAYSGQSTKHLIEIESPGFVMSEDNDNWEAVIDIASGQHITIGEDQNVSRVSWEDGKCYICVTSGNDWVGKSTLTVTAYVDDAGFAPNKRIEIFKVPFIKYIKP